MKFANDAIDHAIDVMFSPSHRDGIPGVVATTVIDVIARDHLDVYAFDTQEIAESAVGDALDTLDHEAMSNVSEVVGGAIEDRLKDMYHEAALKFLRELLLKHESDG